MQSSACSAAKRGTLRMPAQPPREDVRTALQPSTSFGGAGGSGRDAAARRVPGRSRAAAASAAHYCSQVGHGSCQ